MICHRALGTIGHVAPAGPPYPLTFDFLVDDPEVARRFEETVRPVHTVLVALAELQEIPGFAVTAVVADDFVAAVQDAINRSDEDGPEEAFTVERIGGLVAAKNVALMQDYSNVRIVFDPTPWRTENPVALAHAIYLAAHELAHVLFGRLRWISGALGRSGVSLRDSNRAGTQHRADRR